MGFRVSDATLFAQALRAQRQNRFRLAELQSQVATGRRLNSLGDDPGDAARVLTMRRSLAQLEQFDKNLESARSFLTNTEASMSTLTDVLSRLRELAVQAQPSNEGLFQNIKPEVEQLFDEVLRIADTRVGNRFLFGGFETGTAPYVKTGAFVDGVTGPNPTVTQASPDAGEGQVFVQIGDAAQVQTNIEGASLFLGDTDGDGLADGNRVNLFDVVRELRNRLEDPTLGDPTDLVAELDQALTQVVNERGTVGGRLNRLDQTQAQFESVELALRAEKSSIEDVDLVEAITQLQQAETVFQATLGVTARIVQPTLLNFLG